MVARLVGSSIVGLSGKRCFKARLFLASRLSCQVVDRPSRRSLEATNPTIQRLHCQQLQLIAERASVLAKPSRPSYAQKASLAGVSDRLWAIMYAHGVGRSGRTDKAHQLRRPMPLSFPGAICGPPTGPIERTSSVMHPVQPARALPLPGGGTLRPFGDTARKSASETDIV
jgi:hypothetical protein